MPEIQALTARAQNLTDSIDNWNGAMISALVLTALAAIAVVFTTYVVLKKTKLLTKVQDQIIDAKDKQLALDLKDKDVKIAEANQRAADANRIAEGERLARIKIEEKLSGWRLEPEAQERLKEKLKPFAGTRFELAVNPSEARFMDTLDEILVSAGWQRQSPRGPMIIGNKAHVNFAKGISIEFALESRAAFEAPAAALAKALMAEGIPVDAHVVKQGADPNFIEVFIGSR